LKLSVDNLIVPYPANGLSLALGNTGGGDLDTAATSSAYIVLFAANQPVAGGSAGDIYMGSTLTLGNNTTGGTITTKDATEALAITTNTTGALNIGTDSTARTITIGSTNGSSGLVLYGGDDWSISSAGLAVLGTSTDKFTFNPASGPAYAGTARPLRKVTLTPEYPGAVLTGAGTGTMTSDFCEQGFSANITDTNITACESSATSIHNYYSWTSASGSNTYSIYVRWRVPDNFSATGWTTAGGVITNPIAVYARRSDSTDGSVTVTLYDTAGTQEASTQVAGANSTWTQTSLEATAYEGTYTAGSLSKNQ